MRSAYASRWRLDPWFILLVINLSPKAEAETFANVRAAVYPLIYRAPRTVLLRDVCYWLGRRWRHKSLLCFLSFLFCLTLNRNTEVTGGRDGRITSPALHAPVFLFPDAALVSVGFRSRCGVRCGWEINSESQAGQSGTSVSPRASHRNLPCLKDSKSHWWQ